MVQMESQVLMVQMESQVLMVQMESQVLMVQMESLVLMVWMAFQVRKVGHSRSANASIQSSHSCEWLVCILPHKHLCGGKLTQANKVI